MQEDTERFSYRNPDEIKKELAMRGYFYAKGFGGCLSCLKGDLDEFVRGKLSGDRIDYVRCTIQMLVDLYGVVHLEELTDHPDYDLLSRIKRNVFLLKEEVDLILQGKTDTSVLNRLIGEIDDAGCDFRDRLNALLVELRQYPGYERFTFASTDVDGVYWKQNILKTITCGMILFGF
jgi:hypothetical protein